MNETMNVLLLLSTNPHVIDVREIDGICKACELPEGLQPIPGLVLDSHPHIDFPHEIVKTRVLPMDCEGHGARIVVFVQLLDKRLRKRWPETSQTLLALGWQPYRKADRVKAAKPLAA